jgi:uncharacterized protein (TIGR02246 family)
MRRSIGLAAIGLLCVPLAAHAAGSSFAPGSAQACWHDAFSANDVEAVSACYAPDAIMWFPGGPMAKGRQAIHDGYAGFLGANTIKAVTLVELGHEALGDANVTWGTYEIVMVAKDTGVETTERGRFTDVSKKVDGKWLYVVDHPSDDPPPPAPMQEDAATMDEADGQ